ncbi:MAG: hypothetical protein FD180_1254 [Planctomycetota bacterium]|nr:MAG: hypothetical protein FD180_1254 [Planctomycetota bacterium]
MDRLTREILEKIAKEVGKPPDDPQVVQMVYRLVWEIATGQKPADVKREPNPLLPPKEDPAIRPPDAQDLTDLVDSILEDPVPRTEFLAKPRDVNVDQKSTGLWLKGLLGGLREEPKDSPRRKEMREWVAAPRPVAPALPPAVDLAALLTPGPDIAPLPSPHLPVRAATVMLAGHGSHDMPRRPVEKRGPKFAKRGSRAESPKEALTAEDAAKSAPAWLVAAAVHAVVAVVLMNIVYFSTIHRSTDIFRLRLAAAPPLQTPSNKLPVVPGGNQEKGLMGRDNEDSAPSGRPDPLDPQPAGVRLPEIPSDVRVPSISLGSIPDAPGLGHSGHDGLGGMFSGRGGRAKLEALKKNGGDEETEAAVQRGLKWLADHQGTSGAWGLEWGPDICKVNPPCGGMACRFPVGTTAVALLAFLGAGNTHLDGPEGLYAANVKAAAEFLTSRQTKDGRFEEAETVYNYTHAIATYAMCELLAMTQDPRLRPVCERAVGYICSMQQENGGWDYDAQRSGRGDTSISGWMVMALRAARAAGLTVPTATWTRAKTFYVLATDDQRPWVAYFVLDQTRHGGTPAVQASGVLARNYLGLPRGGTLESRTIALLAKTPPSIATPPKGEEAEWHHSFYYVYYATLVMFYNGGEEWTTWNRAMKREVLPMQLKAGHELGSWPTKGLDTGYGGRAYATAMAVLNLEVYYRYLPSYKAEVDLLAPLEDGKSKPPSSRVQADTPSADLLDFLKSGDSSLKRAASRELCRRKEEGALDVMIERAKNENPTLRVLMIEDLAAFGENEKVLKALVEWLDDDSTRGAAMRALRKATGLTGDTPEAWRDWWAGRKK